MGGKYGPRRRQHYGKGPNRLGGRGAGMSSALAGVASIRRAYRNAVGDEMAKLRECGPVRQFTPEEIAKLNAELKK